MKNFFLALAVLTSFLLGGCSTAYNSLAQRPDGTSEIIVTTEKEMLSVSFEAITRTFPAANIQPLAQPSRGYAWFHMPMLDRTNFRFLLSKRSGVSPDGQSITGWSFNVVTQGTQGLVESRYVNPLVAELKSILADRKIATLAVRNIAYVSDSEMDQGPQAGKGVSSGTGFFVSTDGYIVSNEHVVANATKVEVRDVNGKIYLAKIISVDSSNDVALLKIDAETVPLSIAPTSNVKKGAEVFTLGYPVVGIQGQEQKATFGRINALSGIQGDIRYFQIDVPIQPGNSGGPLISDDGAVIAIVTASLNQINVLKATGALPQSVNYAVKAEYFTPLLQFAKIKIVADRRGGSAIKDPSFFEKSVVHIIARRN